MGLSCPSEPFYELVHAPNLEEALMDTAERGADTDTNAAIAGALLGAAFGVEVIPEQWRNCLLECRPSADNPRTKYPRPETYCPRDALSLATQLLGTVAPPMRGAKLSTTGE